MRRRKYLTPQEFAALHGLDIGLVYSLIRAGRIEGAEKRPSRVRWSIPVDAPCPEFKPRQRPGVSRATVYRRRKAAREAAKCGATTE